MGTARTIDPYTQDRGGQSRENPSLTMSKPMPPPIRDYKLLSYIGDGASGEVWLGKDMTETWRAIKILRYQTSSEDRVILEKELKGIRHLQALDQGHPNICTIHHVGFTDDGQVYYVMDLADNVSSTAGEYIADTLRHRINHQRLNLHQAIHVAIQLADGLHYLHENKLIHRDIKPGNVIFVKGVPQIADIGLLREWTAEMSSIGGTPHYMPPEFNLDGSGDVYGLGKVLYEMVTGYSVRRFPEIPSTLLEGEHAPLYREVNEIITKACARNPGDRFKTARHFAKALTSCVQDPETFQDLAPYRESHRQKGSRFVWRAIFAMGLLIMVAWFWTLTHHGIRTVPSPASSQSQQPRDTPPPKASGSVSQPRPPRPEQVLENPRIPGDIIFRDKDSNKARSSSEAPPSNSPPVTSTDTSRPEVATPPPSKGTARAVSPPSDQPTEATTVNEEREEVVFEDLFDGKVINDSLWEWGQTAAFSYKGLGKNSFQVSQANGSLLLQANSEHERGWTSRQDVWVDSKKDLRIEGPVTVDIVFSGSAINGSVLILLCEGEPPQDQVETGALVLYRATGSKNHPLALGKQDVRIMLNPVSGMVGVSATVPGLSSTPQNLSASRLSRWHLRFYAAACSSAGFAPDIVQMRLYKVRTLHAATLTSVVGTVTDALSGLPIPNAQVSTPNGTHRATSDDHGRYSLQVSPGPVALLASAAGYRPMPEPSSTHATRGESQTLDFGLKPNAVKPGQVVLSVPYNHKPVSGLAANGSYLYYVAGDSEDGVLYRMDLDGRNRKLLGAVPRGGGLCSHGGALYQTATWPGRLYRISPEGRTVDVRQLPLDWPHGLTSDGKNLWFLEGNSIENRYAVLRYDPEKQTISGRFTPGDIHLSDLAWAHERLWIASSSGYLYEVDPNKALQAGRMEAGVVRTLSGAYDFLEYVDGYLWGVRKEEKRFCKIAIHESKP